METEPSTTSRPPVSTCTRKARWRCPCCSVALCLSCAKRLMADATRDDGQPDVSPLVQVKHFAQPSADVTSESEDQGPAQQPQEEEQAAGGERHAGSWELASEASDGSLDEAELVMSSGEGVQQQPMTTMVSSSRRIAHRSLPSCTTRQLQWVG
ncbi:unnamed protein product [Vitrella brassicaformis CCMP3155]|uniref:Uncharacterized protein n=1 Tax=Vitrella brassicaformis (strain CCMP3155) TaxID=1169540 RepID=A0A0G4GAZ6_VITBC|nr:unnamed protein product [Vitrella brassicaformis CCMP3155]|eukprot:CEM25991.1 unnamed protein product [Vitrella brassicaformis CCMP3155]